MTDRPVSEAAFRAVSDGAKFYIISEVDETTGRRCASLLKEESPEILARVVADALNLHAMPKLIAQAML